MDASTWQATTDPFFGKLNVAVFVQHGANPCVPIQASPMPYW